MRIDSRTLALYGALLLAAGMASGCSGFRSVTRSTFNTNMVEESAPALTGTDWVLPDGESDAPALAGSWALVEFLDPG